MLLSEPRLLCVGPLALAMLACAPARSSYRDARAAAHAPLVRVESDAGRSDSDPLEGQLVLSHDRLIAAVLEQNPTLRAAQAAWRGLVERVPEAVGLADPMLSYQVAPLSIFASDVRFGHSVMVSQALPWPGKRRLRAEVALAEADVARHDLHATRLRLATMASLLYFDLYLIERTLEVNDQFVSLLGEYEQLILNLLETGRAWQDDAAQIDIEVAGLKRQRIELEAERDVVTAQINQLLHRAPGAALPPPPASVNVPAVPAASADELESRAITARPELATLHAREDAAEAAVRLADRDRYPDLQVMGQYTTMFDVIEHQIMLGVAVNLPVWRDRRRAAVDRSRAEVERVRAETSAQTDQVRAGVAIALERLSEAVRLVALYREELLPAGMQRVEAIRIGLDSGRTSFLEVLRAERDLRGLELEAHRAMVTAHRRRAELDAALGVIASAEVSP